MPGKEPLKHPMSDIYQVCVLHSNRDFFDYKTCSLKPSIGARVWVPFKKQTRLGIVVGNEPSKLEASKLKEIESLIDEEPLISDDLMELSLWISQYYQSYLSEVLPLVLPKKYRQGEGCQLPMADFYQLIVSLERAKQLIPTQAKKQLELVEYLNQHPKPVAKQALSQLGFNSSQLLALVNNQVIGLSQEISLPQRVYHTKSQALSLHPEQAQAVESISQSLHEYRCFVLQGVTGSGKTEVYLQVIAKVLALGRQVLVLVPEIGLTPQLLARFSARFAEPIAVIHSHLNETERQVAWQLAKENRVKLVIGTRSSIFTPLPNLGLIVIDEEHDASLKQMEGVRYSAKDTALMRAYRANIPIILGSATPSLESLHNCQLNKHHLLCLTHKAQSTTALHYQLIDLRSQALKQGLAEPTLKLIKDHLQQNNQVLVFINRRGFAPILLCHHCGWMADCKACAAHLTLHKQSEKLQCHHCGLTQKIPSHCLSCQSKELIQVGAGTQRIHEFLSKAFPNTSIARIDRDEVSKKNAFDDHLEKILNGQTQLIVGTQMLAKGHHFPNLSLVVILDADSGLYNQDFRALEQLGQLLTQVAGRAGRAEVAGEVLIQTHQPDNPLLNLLIRQGYEAFSKALMNLRHEAKLPPYHYLAVIRAQGKKSDAVFKLLQASKEQLSKNHLTILGPAPAPLAKKANQYRMQLLVKSSSRKHLNQSLTSLREWLSRIKLQQNLRWNVDVDPLDLS